MISVVRSACLTSYAEIARGAGLNATRMLQEFGLRVRCLSEADLRIPVDAVRQLLEASAERSGVEGFGLLMAEARRLSNLGPVGLLVREQPTLRLAIEAFILHGSSLNEALFLTIEESGGVVVLREELIVGRSGGVRQSTELAIGVAFRMLQEFLGAQWRPLRVCFAHAPPRNRAVHERVFGRNVIEFGQDFNGIVCARRDLEVANVNADPEIARLARAMLETRPRATVPEMSARVRDLVMRLLDTGTCTVDIVAQHLGVDRRTVHRHLAREDTTFSDVVESVRRELATRYVAEGDRSLADVAALLGFSAASSFSRWYRQCFGSKASESRMHRTPGRRRS